MEKKYKLTEETTNMGGRTLYRIEALRDFSDVKKGDKGGFIENEKNLSQISDCWVYDDAMVYNNAMVYDNARICDNAKIYGEAVVYGDARVRNDAEFCDNTIVYDDTVIYE